MSKIRWGIIGTGKIVRKTINLFISNESEVKVIYGRNINHAKELANEYNIEKYFDDIDKFLKESQIDAIYIATTPNTHLEFVKKCIESKIPVYIEKPMGRNYIEALEIVELYKNNRVPLYTAHFCNSLNRLKKVKELLDIGVIGKIKNVNYTLNRYFLDSTLDTWLYDTEVSGGGKFYDIAPHSISYMVYLFGKFVKLEGQAKNKLEKYEVEDYVEFSFETDKGILGNAKYDLASDKRDDFIIIDGTNGRMEFSIHDRTSIKIIKDANIEEIEIIDSKILQANRVNDVIDNIKNKKEINIEELDCDLETYRIMNIVLEKYYNGRNDEFWNRIDTWNKGK